MRSKIITSLLVITFFSGCAVTQIVSVPFDIANVAIDTTSNAVGLVAKVATTSVDIGSKIVDISTPDIPPVNVTLK